MKVTIYIDVLLVVNLIINYILLMVTAALLGHDTKRIRIVSASLVSAFYSLIIFCPQIDSFLMIPIKLAFAILTVCIAFPYRNKVLLLKQIFVFFVVTYLFAGIMAGIWFTFAPQNMFFYNSTVYFDINTLVLIGTSIAAYGILTLIERIFKKQNLNRHYYTLTITVDGHSQTLHAFTDTGNSLTDLYDNTPIAVCGIEDIASLLPVSLLLLIQNVHQNKLDTIAQPMPDLKYKLRLNPYKTVGEIGVLPCFQPDRLLLDDGEHCFEIERGYLGVSSQRIGDDKAQVALNPEMVKIPVAQAAGQK